MKKLVCALFGVVLFGTLAMAGAPQLIDYQGYLKDGSGNPVTGTVSFTFKIYTDSSGATYKWSETQSSITVTGGLFSVRLGRVTPIPDTVFNQTERWLGIAAGGGSELSPRTRISSSAYAQRVATIDGASGGTVSGDITAGKGNFGTGNTNAGKYAFVAGINNTASADSASVAGGASNTASARGAFIGGGLTNQASGSFSGVLSGQSNRATGYASCVPGGREDTASGQYACAVGYGGKASGDYSVVCGGYKSAATAQASFAAGTGAQANHNGAFVWGDSYTSANVASTANDQFTVRASGGVRLFTNNLLASGVYLSAGGSAWNTVSDSTKKRNIRLVDNSDILSRLMTLPIKQWSYKAQDASIEHIGPMAQDFYRIFKLGDDDKTISTIDPAGIALAAIQALNEKTNQLAAKTVEIDQLKQQLAELKATVEILAAKSSSTTSDKLAVANTPAGK